MADLLNLLKRKTRHSDYDTVSHSPEGKRTCDETKRSDSSEEGDKIMMALSLSVSILTKLKEIENTVKNLENTVSKMQKEVAAVQEKNETLTSTVNEMDKELSFITAKLKC